MATGDHIETPIGYQVKPPVRVAPMPHWPGAKKVIELAVAGYPLFAVGLDCFDKSALAIEYLPYWQSDVPQNVYDALDGPPLLSVYIVDNGAGVREVNGIATRVKENEAERKLAELQKLLGKDRPLAVIGAGLDVSDTVRRYFWKVEA